MAGAYILTGQVSVAILLDSFITARATSVEVREQMEEAQMEDSGTIRSVLDPLLERLTRDYDDDADLSARLEKLFKARGPPTRARAGSSRHQTKPVYRLPQPCPDDGFCPDDDRLQG